MRDSLTPDSDREPSVSPNDADAQALEASSAIGQIGRYTLIRKLGQGGMGMVYLAEQTEPIHRQVALKLVRTGLEDPQILARFEAERQTMALMTHPGIARVFDAGTSPDGRPYFVMEYFPGLPITRYCNAHRLPLRQRLDLFLEVCEAVQHAHEKAVIHRDLKPSNILVAEQDGRARVKVIDFGIARALAEHPGETLTAHDAILGSPAYISPEQLRQGSKCADVRSDVFSLGVVLYELLAGASPFRCRDASLSTLINVLTLEPPPPSRVLEDGGEEAGFAEMLSATAGELSRRLRGDLDAIVLKALDKTPEHRYASALELAGDIRRHFEHRPVSAAHPGTAYRLAKFARRHRALVFSAALVLLALLAGVVGLAVGLRRAREAEATARREADKAKAINEFMQQMLGAADPWKQGKEVKVREVLDAAAREIPTRLSEQPEVEASVRLALGRTYYMLGSLKEGHEQLRDAYAMHQQLLGARDPKTIENAAELVFCLTKLGRDEEAVALGELTLATAREALGPDHPLTLRAMGWLAVACHRTYDYPRAEKLYRERVATAGRIGGKEPTEALTSLHNLVWLLINQERFEEAAPIARRVLEGSLRAHGPEYPLTILARRHHVRLLVVAGAPSAEAEFDALIADHRRLFGPLHPDTINLLGQKGSYLMGQDRYSEAVNSFRETLELKRRVFSETHASYFLTLNQLGEALRWTGQSGPADALLSPALAPMARAIGELNPITLESRVTLALLASDLGRPAQAEAKLRQLLALGGLPAARAEDLRIQMYCALGEVLLHQDRLDEAEQAWRQALAIEENRAHGRPEGRAALARLARRQPELRGAQVLLARHGPTTAPPSR